MMPRDSSIVAYRASCDVAPRTAACSPACATARLHCARSFGGVRRGPLLLSGAGDLAAASFGGTCWPKCCYSGRLLPWVFPVLSPSSQARRTACVTAAAMSFCRASNTAAVMASMSPVGAVSIILDCLGEGQ